MVDRGLVTENLLRYNVVEGHFRYRIFRSGWVREHILRLLLDGMFSSASVLLFTTLHFVYSLSVAPLVSIG